LYAQGPATTQQPAKPVAPSGATVIFDDASLGLRFGYPAQMVKDTSAGGAVRKQALPPYAALNTNRPPACDEHSGCTEEQLSAPFASLSLLEFDRSCVSNDEWQNHDRLLAFFDEDFIYDPWRRCDWETAGVRLRRRVELAKMHMGAVKQPEKDPLGKTHFVVRMNIATMVHDRAVLWVIEANNHHQLNYLEKTKVSF